MSKLKPDAVIQKLNAIRKLYGSPPVVWDAAMAKFAQQWADNQQFRHRMNNKYGENLATCSTFDADMSSAFDMFHRESSNYDWTRPGFDASTGHFTAMVWKSTRRIGCGVSQLPNKMYFYVINFDPPGNIVNTDSRYFKQNVGKKISD
jgi:uncharacterized protein YkwD